MNIDISAITSAIAGNVHPGGVDAEHVDRIQAWMIERGYLPVDQPAHRKIAVWLARMVTDRANGGLLLQGRCGAGKTMACHLFLRCRVVSSVLVCQKYEDSPTMARELIMPPIYDCMPRHYLDVCIDDLGAEDITHRYGKRCDIMREMLEMRYAYCQRHRRPGLPAFTHVSTNLTGQEISERYGDRVVSRLYEMCRTVEFTCDDQRSNPKERSK